MPDKEDFDEEERRAAYLEQLQGHGFWVTSPDESGLTLFDETGSVVQRSDGRPLSFTWAELLDPRKLQAEILAGPTGKPLLLPPEATRQGQRRAAQEAERRDGGASGHVRRDGWWQEMTIFTEIPTRRSSLDEFEAPLSTYLAAVAEDTWHHNPLSAYWRWRELKEAQEGRYSHAHMFAQPELEQPATSMLRPEEARARVRAAGVDLTIPDEGIRGGALDILIARKRAEMRRQDIIARGPGGIVAGAARFGAALGASALDPINVAASFIPVVGQARYAKLLASAGGVAGRAGVRTAVGAAEGMAGAALLEPLIYAAAKQEQADYTLSDSLFNIGVGGALGGALHTGAGAVGDAVAHRGAGRGRTGPGQPASPAAPPATFSVDTGSLPAGAFDSPVSARGNPTHTAPATPRLADDAPPLALTRPEGMKVDAAAGDPKAAVRARRFAQSAHGGKKIVNTSDGIEIVIPRAGFELAVPEGRDPYPAMRAIVRLDGLLASARRIDSIPDPGGRPLVTHVYERTATIDGREAVVRLAVEEGRRGRKSFARLEAVWKDERDPAGEAGLAPATVRAWVSRVRPTWL